LIKKYNGLIKIKIYHHCIIHYIYIDVKFFKLEKSSGIFPIKPQSERFLYNLIFVLLKILKKH